MHSYLSAVSSGNLLNAPECALSGVHAQGVHDQGTRERELVHKLTGNTHAGYLQSMHRLPTLTTDSSKAAGNGAQTRFGSLALAILCGPPHLRLAHGLVRRALLCLQVCAGHQEQATATPLAQEHLRTSVRCAVPAEERAPCLLVSLQCISPQVSAAAGMRSSTGALPALCTLVPQHQCQQQVQQLGHGAAAAGHCTATFLPEITGSRACHALQCLHAC